MLALGAVAGPGWLLAALVYLTGLTALFDGCCRGSPARPKGRSFRRPTACWWRWGWPISR